MVSDYCVICTPVGKQCLTNYTMSLNPSWYNLQEEDSNGAKQKPKELQLKINNVTEPQSPNS